MKKRVVEWLFFIVCCNIVLLHHSLCESESAVVTSEVQGHHLKPLMKGKQLKNAYKSTQSTLKGLHEALQLRARVDVEKEKKAIIDHNKKGKGSNGGGDLLRPRGKRNGANPSLLKSPSLLLVVLRYGILGFLLPSIFFF